MGVLLRLGNVELPPAAAEIAPERRHDLRWEGDLDRKARLVLGHRDDQEADEAPGDPTATFGRTRQRVVGEGVCLTGAVGPEVGVDQHIAVEDDAVGPFDDRRRHELVGLAAGVRGLDRRARGCGVESGGVDDRVVALLGPVPAPVTIHGEVAAPDGGDPGIGMSGGEAILQVLDEAERGRRWRVPAVEQRVDPDARATPRRRASSARAAR